VDGECGDPVRIPVTDVFDLHSVPPRDVEGVVEAYLEEAHSLGLKALRIIHGRGIGAQRWKTQVVPRIADGNAGANQKAFYLCWG